MAVGKNRKPRRIQEVLDGHGLSFADVARALDKAYQTVWSTTHGVKNNRDVLRYYLDLGVAPADLDLPVDMRVHSKREKAAA